jgi:hypothetical protein
MQVSFGSLLARKYFIWPIEGAQDTPKIFLLVLYMPGQQPEPSSVVMLYIWPRIQTHRRLLWSHHQ